MKHVSPRRSRTRGFIQLGILLQLTGAGAGLAVSYMSLPGHYEWRSTQAEMEKAGYPLDPVKPLRRLPP